MTGGRWLVTTLGSLHLFDLSAWPLVRYVRTGGHCRSRFLLDGEAVVLTRIQWWPTVGLSFLVWVDIDHRTDGWWRSSTVQRIEPYDEHGPADLPEPQPDACPDLPTAAT